MAVMSAFDSREQWAEVARTLTNAARADDPAACSGVDSTSAEERGQGSMRIWSGVPKALRRSVVSDLQNRYKNVDTAK